MSQDKILPGTYINFVSVASASSVLSDRGIATMPLELDWGKEGEVFEVSNEDFQKDSQKIFGYAHDHEKMNGLSDLFMNAKTLYAYRLNGGGTKATNAFASALYGGTRGNDIKIVIQANADETSKYDVMTYLETARVDTQTVAQASELVANDYVTFKSDAALEVTAGTALAGGTNATVFSKRMRDEQGVKFQVVLYNLRADYLGVINLKNKVLDTGVSEASLIYWVTGAECGCEVNKSCQNKQYDGAFEVDTDYTQAELQDAILAGEFVLHKVNFETRVLEDINSMVTVTDSCGEIFKDNQTIRVIDQIANDDALLFNKKYLGIIPNNDSGRVSLWSDLVKIRQQLQDIGAIENFTDTDVTIQQGDTKKSVAVTSGIQVVNTMSKLYITVTVA